MPHCGGGGAAVFPPRLWLSTKRVKLWPFAPDPFALLSRANPSWATSPAPPSDPLSVVDHQNLLKEGSSCPCRPLSCSFDSVQFHTPFLTPSPASGGGSPNAWRPRRFSGCPPAPRSSVLSMPGGWPLGLLRAASYCLRLCFSPVRRPPRVGWSFVLRWVSPRRCGLGGLAAPWVMLPLSSLLSGSPSSTGDNYRPALATAFPVPLPSGGLEAPSWLRRRRPTVCPCDTRHDILRSDCDVSSGSSGGLQKSKCSLYFPLLGIGLFGIADKKGEKQNEGKYKHTLNLPKTAFGMRANSTAREPEIQKLWEENQVMKRVVERNNAVGFYRCSPLCLLSIARRLLSSNVVHAIELDWFGRGPSFFTMGRLMPMGVYTWGMLWIRFWRISSIGIR